VKRQKSLVKEQLSYPTPGQTAIIAGHTAQSVKRQQSLVKQLLSPVKRWPSQFKRP
jgi:hypothetical protein